MNIKFNYLSGTKTKNTSKVKLKCYTLKQYDCKFLDIEIVTTEDKKKTSESVMIPIKGVDDIDSLISKLNEMRASFK